MKTRKSFTCYRFGFRFQIIINGTTTTAIILNDDEYDRSMTGFVGVAVLKEPDEYNFELGKAIAMKSAMEKYHSVLASRISKRLIGYQNKLRNFNDILRSEIDLLRCVEV